MRGKKKAKISRGKKYDPLYRVRFFKKKKEYLFVDQAKCCWNQMNEKYESENGFGQVTTKTEIWNAGKCDIRIRVFEDLISTKWKKKKNNEEIYLKWIGRTHIPIEFGIIDPNRWNGCDAIFK